MELARMERPRLRRMENPSLEMQCTGVAERKIGRESTWLGVAASEESSRQNDVRDIKRGRRGQQGAMVARAGHGPFRLRGREICMYYVCVWLGIRMEV